MIKYLWAAIGLLAALLGIQTHRLDNAQTDHSDYVAGIERQARSDSEKAREVERQYQDNIARITSDAHKQKSESEAHVAELSAAGIRLQQQSASLLADRAALQARLAARGKTINDLTDLLAQLRAEADDYAGQLAEALDDSRRAGFICEASYDATR